VFSGIVQTTTIVVLKMNIQCIKTVHWKIAANYKSLFFNCSEIGTPFIVLAQKGTIHIQVAWERLLEIIKEDA